MNINHDTVMNVLLFEKCSVNSFFAQRHSSTIRDLIQWGYLVIDNNCYVLSSKGWEYLTKP